MPMRSSRELREARRSCLCYFLQGKLTVLAKDAWSLQVPSGCAEGIACTKLKDLLKTHSSSLSLGISPGRSALGLMPS
jgi:hypothetical protein